MGWGMPGGPEAEEKFTLQQMCDNLKLEDISPGGPVFDVAKLRWLNGRYLREDFDDEALLDALEGWSLSRDTLSRIVPLAHQRLETLADWGRLTTPFFSDEVVVDPALITIKKKEPDEVLAILQLTLWRLEELRDFSAASLNSLFSELAETFEVKLRDLTLPFYVALSGSKAWTPLFDSMEILGPDLVRVRVRRAIEALGGLSSKRLKEIQKRYTELFERRG